MFPYEDSEIVFVRSYSEKGYQPYFVNISPTVVANWQMNEEVLHHEVPKIWFSGQKSLSSINQGLNLIFSDHPGFDNISATVVNDTWIKRFLKVATTVWKHQIFISNFLYFFVF